MFKQLGRIAAFIAFVGGSAAAFAQGGNSTISGTVFDQDKAVLPGVTVTVTNEATGISRDTVTGPEGLFVIPTLLPGTYTVRAELSGFQAQTREGLVLRVGQEVALDLTLGVAGLTENVTVSAEAPIIETTASRIGAVVSDQEIDQLPSQGRNHLSLMQLVPGLVPDLTPGEFEGGNFNANGRGTASNLWTVDGAANQDTDGGGTGPQARITLDSMAEFQVLTHQYTAEFGGSSGVIVNAVTKSGTNDLAGRAFYYYEDDKLRATDPFVKAAGEPNPEAGRDTFGFNVGGPLVRNRAFFFFNLERNLLENAVVHTMPSEAAPLATSYADATVIKALSTFARVDYTAGANNFSFRWQREVSPAVGEDFECCQTLENRQIELDSNDRMFNVGWTRLFGNRATNEARFSHVGEDRVDGNLAYMNVDPSRWRTSGWIDNLEYVGLNGRDQFDIGSLNAHADFDAGLAAAHGGADSRNYTFQDTFTYVPGSGAHTYKAGFVWNRPMVAPQRIGANDNGTFTFRHNLPFSPANPLTYPSRFSIVMGNTEVDSRDDWYSGFVQDQWKLNSNFTLNLGLRYDYQTLTPESKNALGPRIGFAYDPVGDGRTVVRGGIGKFYEFHLVGVANNLNRRGVFGQTFTFDTGEDTAADRGAIPANVCLQPSGDNGLAVHQPGLPGDADAASQLAPAGCRYAVHQHRAADRRRPAHGVPVVLQHGREARADDQPGRRVRLRRQPGPRPDSAGGYQRGTGGREWPYRPADRGAVRSVRCDHSRGRPQCGLPARAAVPDQQRVRQRLRFIRVFAGEALLRPVEQPRGLHAGLLERCAGAVHERPGSAAGLRPVQPGQSPRVRHELQRDAVGRPEHGRDLPLLLGLPDQRDGRFGPERRPRQPGAAAAGHSRPDTTDPFRG